MKIISADYVLPISAEPIENGAVAVEKDKIVAVGTRAELAEKFPDAATEDFGEAAIMPGFVNAHSHLEITAMRGFLDDVEHDFSAWLIKLDDGSRRKINRRAISKFPPSGARSKACARASPVSPTSGVSAKPALKP